MEGKKSCKIRSEIEKNIFLIDLLEENDDVQAYILTFMQ